MLILHRVVNQKIVMRWGGQKIIISIKKVMNGGPQGKVSIGIEAPQDVIIDREEIDLQKHKEE